MPRRKKPQKPFYEGYSIPRRSKRKRVAISFVIVMIPLTAVLVCISLFLRSLATSIAISDSTDMITLAINEEVRICMTAGSYDYDYFVTLEKDDTGRITAITTNMARINTLSSQLLKAVINSSDSQALDINIPLGNLLGLNLLLGRGPDIPVKIIMLTSSFTDFRNDFSSTGINQSKHEIVLEISVDIDVLLPWKTISTTVVSEILIAETIIVGDVPGTYISME